MPRKAREEFLNSIVASVSYEPKSILEIAKSAETTWESTKKALKFLVSLGIVDIREDGNRKLFLKREFSGTVDNKTFFNIPLTERDENNIKFIFKNAKKTWKDKSGAEIGRTQMQKIIVAVNNTCSLNIPVGRYLYGMMTVMPYDPAVEYTYINPSDSSRLLSSIEAATERYSNLSVPQLKIQHYRETGNILYLAKETTLKLLYETEFNKNGFSNFCDSLFDILLNIPKDMSHTIEAFTEFTGAVNRLSRLGEDDIETVKNDVGSAFNEVWKFVALNMFCKDLSKFYSKQQLMQLNMEIVNQLPIVDEHISILNDMVPKREHPKCAEYEELKKLQGSLKEASETEEKELHELAHDSAKNPSKVFREFGLD